MYGEDERRSESRREAIKRGLKWGASVAPIASTTLPTVRKFTAERPTEPPLVGPFEVGGSNVYALEAEYRVSSFTPRAQELIGQADVVIPQFFPAEWKEQGSQLYDRVTSKGIAAFYSLVAAHTQASRGELWVVDPYYDDAAIAFRGMLAAPEGAALVASAVGYERLAGERRRRQRRQSNKFTRRDVLRSSAVALCALGLEGTQIAGLGHPGMFYAEHSFRQAMSAQHIRHLCESGQIAPGSAVLAVIPHHHWGSDMTPNGIQECLLDRELGEGLAEFWSSMVQKVGLESLLMARGYPTADPASRITVSALDGLPASRTYAAARISRETGVSGPSL